MRVLIVGCGYVGLSVGQELLRQGHEVFGLRRSPEAAAAMREVGLSPVIADVTRPQGLAALPGPFDWVVNCLGAGGGTADVWRAVYCQGTRNLLEALAAAPPRKYVLAGSTGVYGQDDGSVVKESSPTEPVLEAARVLVEAERLLLAAAQERAFPSVILRVAGIYGPGRGHRFKQYLQNQARILSQGECHLNMIHRDDLVGVIVTALRSGRPGEIYNVVDDEPVPEIRFYRWLSETLGQPMPPFATGSETEERKRGQANHKVQNRRLKIELGYQFRYPTFRQGYTEEIRRLDGAGEL